MSDVLKMEKNEFGHVYDLAIMCQTGRFGPVRVGNTRDDVLRVFGKPEKYSKPKGDEIWAYGPVQFFFRWDRTHQQGFLWLIVLNYWEEYQPFRLSTSTQPVGWLPSYETTFADIQAYATEYSLMLKKDSIYPVTNEEQEYLLGDHGQVIFHLIDNIWYVRKICIH